MYENLESIVNVLPEGGRTILVVYKTLLHPLFFYPVSLSESIVF